MNWLAVLGGLEDGLKGAGFDVDNFLHGEVDGAHMLLFRFNCPCGRPLRESLHITETMAASIRSETWLAEMLTSKFRRELQKHVEGEA